MDNLYKKALSLFTLLKSSSVLLAKANGGDDEGENLEEQGFHEIDPFDDQENDEASKWLAENKPEAEAAPEGAAPQAKKELVAPKKSSSGFSEWSPREDYSDEEKKAIEQHVKDGYTHREAERLANAHRSPKSFEEALNARVHPSAPSEKMLEMLRPHAKAWYERAMRQSDMQADAEKNPIKYAAGKAHSAREEHTRTYKQDYNNFLNSPEFKKLGGLEAHHAVQNFKKQWHEKNPEYKEKLHEAAGTHEHLPGAKKARSGILDEIRSHILSGGAHAGAMSAQEAGQHIGAGKDDEGAYTASTFMDPAASFARQNPHFIEHLKSQKQANAPAPKQAEFKPKTITRKILKPEHLQRMAQIHSKKTEGENK